MYVHNPICPTRNHISVFSPSGQNIRSPVPILMRQNTSVYFLLMGRRLVGGDLQRPVFTGSLVLGVVAMGVHYYD